MKERITRFYKSHRHWVMAVAAVVLAAAAFGIYVAAQQLYYQTPNRLWHDALSNSLQTRSATITIVQKTDEADRRQTITFNAGTQNQARSDVVLRSQGSLVVTESIGTKTADYSRYTQIQSKDKDYKNILGVWAKTDLAADEQSESPLLAGIALRTGSIPGVPLVEVPSSKQIDLYKLLNGAVTADFSSAKSIEVDGRAATTFTATIKPQAYITYIKALDDALDYKALSSVTADSYKDRQDVTVSLAVAKDDHRIMRLTIPGVADYQESYGNYGKPFSVAIPDKTITAQELQSRLQND